MREKRISKTTLEKLMCAHPARIFNIKDRGEIRPGYYADLILIDENESWRVEPETFLTRAKYSPFSGMRLTGRVVTTVINGAVVWHNNVLNPVKGMPLEYR